MRLVFKLWRVQVVAYKLVIFVFQAEDYVSSIPPLLLSGGLRKRRLKRLCNRTVSFSTTTCS
jgi:hypothetical protein